MREGPTENRLGELGSLYKYYYYYYYYYYYKGKTLKGNVYINEGDAFLFLNELFSGCIVT